MPPALTLLTNTPTSATYADLMARTVEATAHAADHTRLLDQATPEARAELVGYARFLRVAGRHILLLNALAPEHHPGLTTIAGRLGSRRLPYDVPESRWDTACQALGATHDLLATHIGAGNRLRTPEAIEIFDRGRAGASSELLELLSQGRDHLGAWITKIVWPRNATREHHYPRTWITDLAQDSRELRTNSQAVLWELITQARSPLDAELGGLRLAGENHSLPSGTESAAAALRVIRQITLDQAQEDQPASAASLRDLAALAARVTDPGTFAPGPVIDGLGRLQQAHARDQWERAHQAWTEAGEHLTTGVRTLTKAPAPLGRAFDHLAHNDLPPQVASGIRAALPRLAFDAGETIRRLNSEGNLASYRRQLPEVRRRWLPTDAAEATALSEGFRHAGTLTRHALTATPQAGTAPGATPRSAPSRQLTRTQEVSHVR